MWVSRYVFTSFVSFQEKLSILTEIPLAVYIIEIEFAE